MSGHKETSATLRRLARTAPKALNIAVYKEAAEVMRLAQIKAPIKTGALRASWFLAPSGRWESPSWSVEGGFGVHYAYIVHSTHRSRSQFLTQAMSERHSGRIGRIAADVKAMVASGNVYVPNVGIPRVPRI